jgi:putative chitinase
MTATVSIDLLMTVAPSAPSTTLSALMAGDALNLALAEFEVNTPHRVAAFLAQVAHETGGFRWLNEIWGPTKQQKKYDPPGKLAKTLGNTERGDGARYKGRGLIQITGRGNYRTYGRKLKLPLEDSPELAAIPEHAARIAACYWHDRGLNELADQATNESFVTITKRINGGLNGLNERVAYWQRAKDFLGILEPSEGAAE